MVEVPSPVLELRRVTKTFREGLEDRKVLRHADLRVGEGELVVLLGRSGSGKSTLLHLLSGIDLPSAGDVFLRDTAINRLSERQRTLLRRHEMGFVFQFFNLIPTLTVEENLLLPLELAQRGGRRSGRRERERALHLLDVVGLAQRRASFPDVLSGGEQQRVAIARALAHDPWVILADEPTGNLDFETARQVLALFERTVREAGKTLVVATHSREVARLADRVLRVEDGHLVEMPADG